MIKSKAESTSRRIERAVLFSGCLAGACWVLAGYSKAVAIAKRKGGHPELARCVHNNHILSLFSLKDDMPALMQAASCWLGFNACGVP
jgi:hypothetical protein